MTDPLRDAHETLLAVEHDLSRCGHLSPETIALVAFVRAELQKEIEAGQSPIRA